MIKSIPLNKLVASPRNVRRSGDAQADAELKADIEARGLLQNLVVTSITKPKGCFAVEAGERRRRALQSLAENFQRLAMNPADECLAFSALVEQGSDAEGIARRFGLTVRFVEGRLRLAGLAPVVFEALGSGEISLDAAKAYAATPDRERQEYVFEQMSRGYGAAHPDSIRRMMTQATISATDRRARFVGDEAYLAAGGRIERDLFSDEDNARWLDVALVERLATEKMEKLAAETAAEQGLAFVRPSLDHWLSYSATEGLRRVQLETPPLTDEESARVDELEEEIGGLVDLLEDEESDDAARADAEAKIAELDRALDAIVNKPPVIDDEKKSKLGTFLLLDDQGRPRLDTSFYAEISADDASAGDANDDESNAGDDVQPSGRAGLSRRLVDELAMQRRDVLSLHIASDPGLALDLLVFTLADGDTHDWR